MRIMPISFYQFDKLSLLQGHSSKLCFQSKFLQVQLEFVAYKYRIMHIHFCSMPAFKGESMGIDVRKCNFKVMVILER